MGTGLVWRERMMWHDTGSGGIADPFAYLDHVKGQALQPHQREAVEAAARLVAGVPS